MDACESAQVQAVQALLGADAQVRCGLGVCAQVYALLICIVKTTRRTRITSCQGLRRYIEECMAPKALQEPALHLRRKRVNAATMICSISAMSLHLQEQHAWEPGRLSKKARACELSLQKSITMSQQQSLPPMPDSCSFAPFW